MQNSQKLVKKGFLFLLVTALWVSVSVWAADGKPTVVILGGGVAGMSTAHELAERDFDVSVYEMKDIAGGKARSIGVPDSGSDGRKDLPGEHGFRFFPGFYQHVIDTMKRIPYGNNPRGVYDNLASTTRTMMATDDEPYLITPTGLPRNIDDFVVWVKFVFNAHGRVPKDETAFFARKLYVLFTSSDERRLHEFENISWWKFIEADSKSLEYQKYFGKGLTRTLVAAKAEKMSARTAGMILGQLLLNVMGMGDHLDRVLMGPTNEVWINPWLSHLENLGVNYHLGAKVESIEYDGSRVVSAKIEENGKTYDVKADYFVLATPIEVAQKLIPQNMAKADPIFNRLKSLNTEWMTGMQFFLSEDLPLVHGHTIYFDSPWALTSISQKQFWPKVNLADYGDGSVKGILSVDISDWDKPGILYKKPAKQCSRQEIRNEVVAQLISHWNRTDTKIGVHFKQHLLGAFLDPGITFPAPGRAENSEPLLVNTVGSWWNRPTAETKIPNFFLAADYVQTNTDLATMEAANEAARRAANGIIKRSGKPVPFAKVWKLKEPWFFQIEKLIDRIRYKRGKPHRMDKAGWCEAVLAKMKWKQ